MDTAVEAAEERPHFLISAPPRLATCGGEQEWGGEEVRTCYILGGIVQRHNNLLRLARCAAVSGSSSRPQVTPHPAPPSRAAHLGRELLLQPLLIADDVRHAHAANLGVQEVGDLGWMVGGGGG